MFNPFKKEKVRVFHPSSPGVWVTVERNWFQRIIYPEDFATLGEVVRLYKKERKNNK